jgi:hypothetical protein
VKSKGPDAGEDRGPYPQDPRRARLPPDAGPDQRRRPYDFDKKENNFTAAVAEYVSWGFFDFRRKGEDLREGYQSPPVLWGQMSARKQAFFDLVKEISGE